MPTPLADTSHNLNTHSLHPEADILPFSITHHSEQQELDSLTPSGKREQLPHISTKSSSSVPPVDESEQHLLAQDPAYESDDSQTEESMGRARNARSKGEPSGPASSSSATSAGENGHTQGDMNGQLEYRRKTASIDTPDVTRNLMSRESFSLDDAVPQTPTVNNHGFFELPKSDQRNFCLLVLLYFMQGVPMGLATGSVPFLLKPYLSYGQIGIFSLASYPYSLKLLWSPIVDAVWSPKVGRRKSWIMPIQIISGLGMIYLGGRIKEMMVSAGANGGAGVWSFTWWWFFLVFTCATQDIAVDGWALTLLSPGNISYASTAQTVGLTAGQFMSYTVFLAFNSPDFTNKFFGTHFVDEGLMSLGGYLSFWGWTYILVTIGLGVFKREEKTKNEDGIYDVYKVMWGVLKLKNIQTIIIIHLIAKIGFQANDAVTNLKLLDKGFSQEDLALTVLIDFPFEIGLGYYAGKWSTTYTPMRLWCWSFVGRLIAAVIAQITVAIFPTNGVETWYLLVVIAEHIFSTFTSTVMFVAISAFHARISDPVIGGTYMTLLATVSNLGGTFPRFFVLKLVDMFTSATCNPPASDKTQNPFNCVLQVDKDHCKDIGGTCNITRDGYYITNVVCILFGIVTFWGFIKPAAIKLQALPLRAWRIGNPPN